MSQFAKNIKTRRTEKNLTQEEFADKLNVSRTSISNWETGKNYPDFCLLVEISNVLDISLDVLIKEDYEFMKHMETKEKWNKRRNRVIAVLIPLVCVFAVGLTVSIFQLNTSDISKDEIQSATVKNGNLIIKVDLNSLESLDGWMLEGNREKASLSVHKVVGFSNILKKNKSDIIEIPLGEWEGVDEFIMGDSEVLKIDYTK